jgi:NCS1 family nucleobase:cation symporter-1
MLADYYFVNRQRILLSHLFVNDSSSKYWFSSSGINWRAPLAWVIGIWPAMREFFASYENANIG